MAAILKFKACRIQLNNNTTRQIATGKHIDKHFPALPLSRHGATLFQAVFTPIFLSFGLRLVWSIFFCQMLQLIVYFIRQLCYTDQRGLYCSVTEHSCPLEPKATLGLSRSKSKQNNQLKASGTENVWRWEGLQNEVNQGESYLAQLFGPA